MVSKLSDDVSSNLGGLEKSTGKYAPLWLYVSMKTLLIPLVWLDLRLNISYYW